MKRQELHNYIRKEIINELTEDAAADKAAQDAEKIAVDKKIAALNKKKSELNKGPASSLAEMARIPNKIKLGDPEKVEIAKEAYAGSEIEKLIDFVKEAGEEGITQDELAKKLEIKNSSSINSDINDLVKAGVFSKPKKTKEEPKEEEPEEDEIEVKDDWEKPEEEEEKPEEPKAAELKAIEKSTGKTNAKTLSPEEQEKYEKLKKGIEVKLSKISKLKKDKRSSSDDFKVLKQLINRDDVKKLFKSQGVSLKDLVSDIIK